MTDQNTPRATASDARFQLDARVADREWGARVLNGDVSALRELRELTEISARGGGDVAANVMSGKFGKPGSVENSEHAQIAAAVDHFRKFGVKDDVIAEFLTGEPVSRADYDAVANWKKVAMGSRDFADKFLAGDIEAGQKMILADSVLARGFKEEAE